MPLYATLRRRLGVRAATIAFALIYASLLLAIVLLLQVPATDLRYARY